MERRGRWYAIPAHERDRMIVALKRRGYTNERIGKAVGMTEAGVRAAVKRIKEGRFGEGQTRA